MANECKRFAPALPGYLDATLGAPDRAALETHLKSCPECNGRLERLRRLDTACAGLREASADAGESAALKSAVLDRVRRAPAGGSRRRLHLRPAWKWLPIAAAVAAVLVLSLFLWPSSGGSSGIAWADVMKSVKSAPWVHYVTRNAASGEVIYDEWGTPDNREIYVKVDKCDKWRPLPMGDRFTNFMQRNQWTEGTGTIVRGINRSISRGRTDGPSTVFDIVYSGPLLWWQTRTDHLYVDTATSRPTRIESECFFNLNGENETANYITDIDYPSAGPSELYAVGVPHGPEAQNVQPPADVQPVIAEYNRCRDAFAAACAEYRALCHTDVYAGFPTYLLNSRGVAYRLESYMPGAPRDPILSGGFPSFGGVEICDGTRRRDWEGDGRTKVTSGVPPESLRRSAGLSQCDPVNFSWSVGLGGPVKLIKSDDPARVGLIGLEFTGTSGDITRRRYWINPQRDYILQRLEWDEFTSGRWEPLHREDVLDYAQLSTGQYYVSAKRIFGRQFASHCTYTIIEHPTFDTNTFDPDIRPWTSALISVTDPQGAPVENVKLASLRLGWQPRSESRGSAVMIDNIPREGATDMLLYDDARGLAKAVTVTPEGDQTKLTIALEQGIPLEGFVKTESGAPLAGANVLLCPRQKGPGTIPCTTGGMAVTTTDDAGHYAFNLVSPGVEYCAQIYHDDYGRAQEVVTVDPAARTARVADIVARDRMRIGGRVTDASTGLPIEGVTVRYGINWEASFAKSGAWNFGHGYQWETTTDKDGRWSAGANPLFVNRVFVGDMRYQFSSYDAVEAGRTDVDFQLTPIPEPVQ